MDLTEVVTDLDDLVQLGDFVELVWAPQLDERAGDPVARRGFAEARNSALRMRRQRDATFPDPPDASSGVARYRLRDLIAWLDGHPEWLEDNHGTPGSLVFRPSWLLTRAETACRAAHGARNTRQFAVGALVALKAAWGRTPRPGERLPRRVADLLAPGADLPRRMAAALPGVLHGAAEGLLAAMPDESAPASRLARALALTASDGIAWGDLADQVLERLATGGPANARTASPHQVIDLIIGVADPNEGQRLYDPACGEGGLLLAAARHAGAPLTLVGREQDRVTWQIAVCRLSLHDLAADLGAGPTDSLASPPPGRFDVVVLDPPLQVRRAMRWVRHAVDALAPGGTAVVALLSQLLTPGRREPMPAGGHLEAAVITNSRFRPETTEPTALWILTAEPTEDPMLLVDASSFLARRGDVDAIGQLLAGWHGDRRARNQSGMRVTRVPRSAVSEREGPAVLMTPTSPPPVDRETARRAQQLTKELLALVDGPLHEDTTDEIRRALQRLMQILGPIASS